MAYQKLQGYRAASVTPSDTVVIPSPGGGSGVNNGCVLYIGIEGDLKVTTAGNDDIVFKNVPVGFFPVNVLKVWATGTVASEIIALW
tara:strand:- start:846 stop:1106 length:261 start_codon:yes stop_codon:yes gene_type:complete